VTVEVAGAQLSISASVSELSEHIHHLGQPRSHHPGCVSGQDQSLRLRSLSLFSNGYLRRWALCTSAPHLSNWDNTVMRPGEFSYCAKGENRNIFNTEDNL